MEIEAGFEWDADKARTNQRRHGVTFQEARTVFDDPLARLIEDPDHSTDEQRFLLLGLSTAPRLLVVAHCQAEKGEVIRLISARRATPAEAEQYNRWRS